MAAELIEAELSYEIVGLIFRTHKELGYGYQEKYYQRTFEQLLKEHGLLYKREVSHPITLKGSSTIVGRYIMVFVVADRVVVEWKIANQLHRTFVSQVLAYLKSSGYRLGIIALVTPQGVEIKRLVN